MEVLPAPNPTENGMTCFTCNMPLIIMDDGFPTCGECGHMVTKVLDHSPEWRFFGGDDKNGADPTRCGIPINPLLQESSFGCKIMCRPNATYEMKCIRRLTEWISMPHKEKALYEDMKYISAMALNSGLPRIFIDEAVKIHKDISEQKMFRGMNRDAIKAASIYLSCRLGGYPRTAHEIADMFRLDKPAATSGCSMAVNIFSNLDRNGKTLVSSSDMCTTLPSSFIERFCSGMQFNYELTHLCRFIARKIEAQGWISDNTPHSIAAGILFFVGKSCHLGTTKAQVRQVCNVSEVTISKCCKKLELKKDLLLPPCLMAKYSSSSSSSSS